MSAFQSLEWRLGVLRMLDQRRLPHEIIYFDITDPAQVVNAIRDMVVRGAPAIGAAAAWGMALVPFHTTSRTPIQVVREMEWSRLPRF